MISSKVIATLALTTLSGFTGTTAVYLETHPGTFIGRTEGHLATLLTVAPNRAAVHVLPAPTRFVQLEPVLITSAVGPPSSESEAATGIDDGE